MISTRGKHVRSTTAGNLISQAMRDVHNLDVVFYPVDFLDDRKVASAASRNGGLGAPRWFWMYPDLEMDQFAKKNGNHAREGHQRVCPPALAYRYDMDLEVAGLIYTVGYASGVQTTHNAFAFDVRGNPLEDDQYYRVAWSEFMFFGGNCFPCYLFGDGLNFHLNPTGQFISAKES